MHKKDWELINYFNDYWLIGTNQNWIEKLYKDFLNNPNLIENEWYIIFNKIKNFNIKNIKSNNLYFHNIKNSFSDEINNTLLTKVFNLIYSFRCLGHKKAKLDPLNLIYKKYNPALDIKFYNIKEEDLNKKVFIKSFSNKKISILKTYNILKKVYCNSIGIEYMHLSNNKEKYWIEKKIESFFINKYRKYSKKEKTFFLKNIIFAKELEKFLEIQFPGSKRFSLEGCESIIVFLNNIINLTKKNKINEIFLGMAHRGRINILINVLKKNPKLIFDQFLEKNLNNNLTGDVKYHTGSSSQIIVNNHKINLNLAFNPSHLEIINPVIMGCAKAKIDKIKNLKKILSITIHGDASFSGQGIVQETLNMSQADGYKIGGTIRVVINNQIGFTTSRVKEIRSTDYCTDIGKMIDSPIFHVNVDDIEAVAYVSQMSLDFKNIFHKDVFVDLVCYRKHGHHESDEPSVTQPLMYKKIRSHPDVMQIYFEKLKLENVINEENKNDIIKNYYIFLENTKNIKTFKNYKKNRKLKDNKKIKHLSLKKFKFLFNKINYIPKNINVHYLVNKIYEKRKLMANGEIPLDWGAAETLAYASLLYDGISCRISGEDSVRGTFFHRNAIIYDQKNYNKYIPLKRICNTTTYFTILNSVLSEESALAFEYGYSLINENDLIVWEAQFGDFSNGAQIVIDQFISTGEKKWGQMSGIVLLLPHGYEGQGPEHSSARLERYLQLCAENNIQVCMPTTPAQIYHLLRRQIKQKIKKPLIIFSPKSLLRNSLVYSNINEFINNDFKNLIKETDKLYVNNLKKVIFCSGKIYYDLIEKRKNINDKNTAIIRIEQLYPFPYFEITKELKNFYKVNNFLWCQEEPRNQGAWYYVERCFRKIYFFNNLKKIKYVGRAKSAVTAVGYYSIHKQQQKEIIEQAFNL